MNLFSISSTPFIICFFTSIAFAIHDNEYRTGDISINCGSTENFAAVDGREWIGDKHGKISSVQMNGSSTSSSMASGQTVSTDQAQFGTARISRSPFSYTFQLSPGHKFIRLHFNPVSYRGFEGSKDLFTVEAGPFTLVRNFSASLTAGALGGKGRSFVKEFCINIEENQSFNISFYPYQSARSQDSVYAFINGIQIVSLPAHVSYFYGGIQVVGNGIKSLDHIYDYNHTALEIIHRQKVKPSDDFVNMFEVRATVSNGKTNQLNNVTWKIAVDMGFRYLVRIHFSEFLLKMAETEHVIFEILINDMKVDSNIDLVKERNGNSILQYKDYITSIQGREHNDKHNLSISIKTIDEFMDGNGPLKGFEMLKLSNLHNSLASPNPLPSACDSPPPTLRDVFKVGGRNIIATAAIAVIVLVNIIVHKLRQSRANYIMEEDKKPSDRARRFCRRFTLAEIQLATKNFSDAFVIGMGGFGKVYKGRVDNGKEIVAMKRLKYSSKQGAREFWTEIEILSKLRHINLVSLIGYCNEQQEMILTYEYMARGSLADHLYKKATDENHSPSLSWKQRLNICIEAGRGLDYLHTGHGIIHRDVKTSNILLDENFVAKVSDFGLAKPEKGSQLQGHSSTNVKGTHGYFDPYYIRTRKRTMKSDIYAFGVVLLEVLCGRPALDPRLEENQRNLATWARENISRGDIEKIVSSNIREEILSESLNAFVRVAENCLDDEPKKRLAMAQVVLQLEFALHLQENPNSSESKETSIANGSAWDALLKSIKTFTQKDLEAPTSGRNKLLNERQNSLAEVKVTEFDWQTIQAVTNGFSDSHVIGKGREGIFYKAELHTGQVVVVKLANRSSNGRSMSELEISFLSKYKHPNIKKLLGYFTNAKDMILVYEFMENSSLKTLLFEIESRNQLPWTLSFELIIGIARGVRFLHQSPDLRTIYCSIDPCNIFLDTGMNPKIAIECCKPTNLEIMKTSEYAAPEGCQVNQRYSSDIYSFGVIVLEIVSGWKHRRSKQHLNLIAYAWKLWLGGKALELVNTKMGSRYSSEEAITCIQIALLCTQFEPQHRPEMSLVLRALHGDQDLDMDMREAENRRYNPHV